MYRTIAMLPGAVACPNCAVDLDDLAVSLGDTVWVCPRCLHEVPVPAMTARRRFCLRDGRSVHLRPVHPSDINALIAFHQRLSQRSRYHRYFGAKPTLTLSEARYFATVDGDDRFGTVAITDDSTGPAVVGHAMLIRIAPDRGELALAVSDDHQGVGLGAQLGLMVLATAVRHRIRYLTGPILVENRTMLSLAISRGGRAVSRSGPEMHYELDVRTFRTPIGAAVPAQDQSRRKPESLAAQYDQQSSAASSSPQSSPPPEGRPHRGRYARLDQPRRRIEAGGL
ncbi:MAG TPA: GNAT family N-acetyltransferase [Sporichthyaceae bacterium]|jgi:GNAT superfamily N-acetyltransferase